MSRRKQDTQRLFSAADVAAVVGVTRRTINRWAKSGRIRGAAKTARGWLFDDDDVDDINILAGMVKARPVKQLAAGLLPVAAAGPGASSESADGDAFQREGRELEAQPRVAAGSPTSSRSADERHHGAASREARRA